MNGACVLDFSWLRPVSYKSELAPRIEFSGVRYSGFMFVGNCDLAVELCSVTLRAD